MPATVIIERSAFIAANPDSLKRRIANLPAWVEWSPWEDLDPRLDRRYSGAPGAVGSSYAWMGNRRAGAGRMVVTAVDLDGVSFALVFEKPFRSSNSVRFVLSPEGDGTRAIWRMESPATFLTRVLRIEKAVGADFERGLRRLKDIAERESGAGEASRPDRLRR